MKKAFWLFVVAGVWLGLRAPAWAQSSEAHGQLIEQMAGQIKTMLNADRVLGTPQDFQGTKVVPIVSMVFGFGSGIGVEAEDERQGSGAGGGGAITPNGLLVVAPDGGVRVIAAKKSGLAEILKEALPMMMESMRDREQEEKEEK